MEQELQTIQELYNVVVEFIINYSFQILGAIIILIVGGKVASWLGGLVTRLCEKKNVDITLSNGVLTIRGEKKREDEEKGKDFYRKERSFGAFRRSLPIPAEVDEGKIDASFTKGVLYIELPKTEEARKKVTHIDVKAA